MKKSRRKYSILLHCLLIFTLLFSLTACGQNKPDPREKEIIQLVASGNHDEAIKKANELFKGEDKKLAEVLDFIYESAKGRERIKQMRENAVSNENSISKLEIQPNHSHKIKGDYYYITGRVKNTSNTNISYFEVRCDFLDSSGQVLDSDYTNDGLVLKPGEMREFEIMHKYNSEYDKYKLSIGNVK